MTFRKILLATSALATCAVLAQPVMASEPINVKIGGYMNQWFGYQDNDIEDIQSFEQWSDTAIDFTGETKLDNGLTVGLKVSLEGNTNGDQIDYSYAYVEGNFGKLVLGSDDDAAFTMQVVAPNVGLPINSGSQTQHIINPTGSALFYTTFGSTFITPALDDTGQKVTYYSPRFSGFQFGVSYLPDVDSTGGDRNALTSETVSYTDGFSVGLNYDQSYDQLGLDLAASLGYYYAGAPDGAVDIVEGGDVDNFKGYSAGLNLGYAGFTLGGSYAKITDGVVSGVRTTEGDAFDVGLAYEIGALGVSLTYFDGNTEGDRTISGDDENHSYALSASYKLGEGISVLGTLGYTEFDGEVSGRSDDNDGVYAVTGLALSF